MCLQRLETYLILTADKNVVRKEKDMNWNEKFSERAGRMRPSAIRQLLALTQKPDIISLAGGLPDPALFPVDLFAKSMDKVIREDANIVLQYGETPGYRPLRELLVERCNKEGENITVENLIVTTASQQGIDLIGKVFIDPGDTVIVEGPTYLAALQAFGVYGAEFATVDMDLNGMMMDKFDECLADLDKKGIKPKFIYTVPTFQNPAGYTMPLERRKHLLKVAKERGIPIIEDNPYGELRFAGEPVPSFQSMDKEKDTVISLRTFSKILCPGLRLGWIVGPEDALDKVRKAKEASDLCSPVTTQAAAADFIKQGHLDAHIPKIRAVYKEKYEAMRDAIEEHFPKLEGLTYAKAEGGMFIWVSLPERFNMTELFNKALENKVAYIVGSAFYANGKGHNCFRLNFSFAPVEKIKEGIKRIGNMLKSV